MGLLMAIGMLYTIGYMGYACKKEGTAKIANNRLKPTNLTDKDKEIIRKNFKLICKRCDVKLDKNGYPVEERHYNVCKAYLMYQGFSESMANYFQELYTEKYNYAHDSEINRIETKHKKMAKEYCNEEKIIKIYRDYFTGAESSVKEKCDKMIELSPLWKMMVKDYNIIDDGYEYVVAWNMEVPESLQFDIKTINKEIIYLMAYKH